MCVAIPSRITSIDEKTNTATVETMGVERKAALFLLEEPPKIGDYVVLHVGFAMSVIDEHEALESIKLFKLVIEDMEKSAPPQS
jgi:hydrogenase expression/formation protein HypC